jgi:hypothetical protein
MKAGITTSRNLQFFVAGALFSHGFGAWIVFAWSLWAGSLATALHWAAIGVGLPMAIGLFIGTRSLVRVVQIYLFIYMIGLIGVLATGGPRDSRYPTMFSKGAIIVALCEGAILLILLSWSTSKPSLTQAMSPNQSLEPTTGHRDAHI